MKVVDNLISHKRSVDAHVYLPLPSGGKRLERLQCLKYYNASTQPHQFLPSPAVTPKMFELGFLMSILPVLFPDFLNIFSKIVANLRRYLRNRCMCSIFSEPPLVSTYFPTFQKFQFGCTTMSRCWLQKSVRYRPLTIFMSCFVTFCWGWAENIAAKKSCSVGIWVFYRNCRAF